MADIGLETILLLAASVTALALLLRVLTEGRRTQALREERDELLRVTRGSRKQEQKREKALREAENRAQKAGGKAAQVERRVVQGREASRAERAVLDQRVAALETQLAEARSESEQVEADLARARAELSSATEHVAKAEARALAAEQAEAQRPPVADPQELVAASDRAERAEASLATAEATAAEAIAKNERLRSKLETQEMLYVSIRSELEVKKDQIRQQRAEIERLQAYKVALVDVVVDDS